MAGRVEWVPEYRNQEIVRDVFNRVDAIVVPSVWVENSPLVIHEAQQARVPVITADAGGMAEYVHHEVNGLLFAHRSMADLAVQMQRFVDNPDLAKRLAARGYLYSGSGVSQTSQSTFARWSRSIGVCSDVGRRITTCCSAKAHGGSRLIPIRTPAICAA